jgi:hypothetical protein
MHGISGSRTGHAISRVDIGNPLADCDHGTGTAVSQRSGLVETMANRR